MSLYTRHKDEHTSGGNVCDPFTSRGRLMPHYFVSRVLAEGDRDEPKLRDLELSLTMLAARLRPYTVFTSDTDCDGTSFQAQRRWATSADQACKLIGGMWDVSHAIPEDDFLTDYDSPFRTMGSWNQDYYIANGYMTLGNTWS